MKRQYFIQKTQIEVVPTEQGESIEEMLRRMTANNEPVVNPNIKLIYTPKKDGVLPEYDIRTDRYELALKANDKAMASIIAKSDLLEPDQIVNNNTNPEKIA